MSDSHSNPELRLSWLDARLADLAASGLLRRPVEVTCRDGCRLTLRDADGAVHEVIDFCSNNYLGLAGHPAVCRAAVDAVAAWGLGAAASRLITGTTSLHRHAERELAALVDCEDAILLSTGYQTNLAAVMTLAEPGDTIILDKLCHASMIDAARQSGARLRTYAHCDAARLAEQLARSAGPSRRFVLTDSVFSMDGDAAPLADIIALRQRHDFVLMVDEAHALGVLGNGGGLAQQLGLTPEIDLLVGTCSKALGGAGGFVAGSSTLVNAIRNMGRPFIYSTAPPPAVAAGITAAVGVVRDEPDRRRRLLHIAAFVRERLTQAGWDISPSSSHIIPIRWGSAASAVVAQQKLLSCGVLALAIRPPTVPRGTSRLRVSLMCDHTRQDVERLLEALDEARSSQSLPPSSR